MTVARGGRSGSPPAGSRTAAQLVGLSLDDVKAQIGPPDSESVMTGAPDFGPWPAVLVAGDTCTYLDDQNHQGEQLQVYAVPPDVYARVKGSNPGDQPWYVLQVFAYPRHTVF